MKAKRILILLTLLTIAALLFSSTAFARGSGWKVKTSLLVQGSPVHDVDTLEFGPDGLLYKSSGAGGISIVDPKNGKVIQHIGLDQDILTPQDVAFGPDERTYLTEYFTGNVKKQLPDGTYSVVGNVPAGGLYPITFSRDGRLFAGSNWDGQAYEVDPQGTQPPRVTAQVFAYCLDFGPDGLLYMATDNAILRINVDTGEVTNAVDGLGTRCLRFDSRGRLYDIEYTGEVVRIDLATGAKKVIARLSKGLSTLAFDAHDRLFVGNELDGYIFEVLPNGMLGQVVHGGLIFPAGVAVKARPDGDNFLVTTLAGSVEVWDVKTLQVLESYWDFPGPYVAIRLQGDIVVSASGQVIRNTSQGWVTLAQLTTPTGLVARGGDLWVSDWTEGKVYQIVAHGKALAEPKQVASGLNQPQGLAFDHEGGLLVVEGWASRLSRIDLNTGEVVTLAEGLELGELWVGDSLCGSMGWRSALQGRSTLPPMGRTLSIRSPRGGSRAIC